MTYLLGSHHVTLSVGKAQEDVDFHTKVLGMRFIKKTVLYDGSIPIYHLYTPTPTAIPPRWSPPSPGPSRGDSARAAPIRPAR